MPSGAKPGQRRGGRQKGTRNKISRDLRQVFIDTFNSLQGDKHANLYAWAKLNPEKFYPLAARLIPQQHIGDPAQPIVFDHTGQITLYIPDNGRSKDSKESPLAPAAPVRVRLRLPNKGAHA